MTGSIFEHLKSKVTKREPEKQQIHNDKTEEILSSLESNRKPSAKQSPEEKTSLLNQEKQTIGGAFSGFLKKPQPKKPEEKPEESANELVAGLERKTGKSSSSENTETDDGPAEPVQVGESESVLPELPEKKPAVSERKKIVPQEDFSPHYGHGIDDEDLYESKQSEAQLAKEIIEPLMVEKNTGGGEESELLNIVVIVLILVGIVVLLAIWFYFFGGG